jgi:3',5'-cyclic AMP phosphodiesterase CpdA
MAIFTLAHLSDVHLGPIAGFTREHWNLKRVTGYINWRRTRRHAYQREALDRLLADLNRQGADHIAVTGDLVNIGLPQEHIAALAWLETLGAPDRVTLVPGNHDIYSRIATDLGTARWARYMRWNNEAIALFQDHPEFPFVRLLGNVALVGVNSAVPTPPLLAWGEVGSRQRAALESTLADLRRRSLFRVVLIHHPPLAGQANTTRGLRDAPEVQSVLSRTGAELVLHGHNHRNMVRLLDWKGGTAAVIGVPSASLGKPHGIEPLARYNLYRIDLNDPSAILMIGRGLSEPDGPIVELERRHISLGGRAA